MDELVVQLKEFLRQIRPSMYSSSLIPPYDPDSLDKLAAEDIFPSFSGLANAAVYVIYFNVARYLLTLAVFKPLAMIAMKLKYSSYKVDVEIDVFAKKFNPRDKIKLADVKKFCESSKRVEAEVQQYLTMKRHNAVVDTKITKFTEALWRFMFYAYFCYLGIRALFFPTIAPWLLDTMKHWEGWPLQPISDPIKFYYHIELAAYIHQLMWTEVSRSDTVEMVLHHVTTIILVGFSFLTSFTRIGSSIFLVHDISDVFLEAAKVFNYTSKAKGNQWASIICDSLFLLFAVSFFVLRLVIFPRYLVYSLVFESPAALGMWPCYWILAALLVVLQCLHVFWFYLIARMVPSLLKTGIQKDERSDDEGDEDVVAVDGDDAKKQK